MTTDSSEEKSSGVDRNSGAGVGIGVAIGVAIGAATDNIGLWIALGVAIGAGLDWSARRRRAE